MMATHATYHKDTGMGISINLLLLILLLYMTWSRVYQSIGAEVPEDNMDSFIQAGIVTGLLVFSLGLVNWKVVDSQ
jgi:hypothetical protein